jgi:hypothetical protein
LRRREVAAMRGFLGLTLAKLALGEVEGLLGSQAR